MVLGSGSQETRWCGESIGEISMCSRVPEGVLRFVTGQYSLSHDHAVMLGYVVAGPMDGVVTRVKTAMDRNAIKTRQLTQFSLDRYVYDHPYIYSSRHIQDGAQGAQESFKLVHLLVDLS